MKSLYQGLLQCSASCRGMPTAILHVGDIDIPLALIGEDGGVNQE
jgi:hypothetical protein